MKLSSIKSTEHGVLTFLVFITEERWKRSVFHSENNTFNLKNNTKPPNKNTINIFYRIYLKYPKNSTYSNEDILNFFDSKDEIESISANPEKGYIIVYLASDTSFFKYLNKSALHKNNKSLGCIQSLSNTSNKKYVRIWLTNLPSNELSPIKLWKITQQVLNIQSTPLYGGRERDLRNKTTSKIFYWINNDSDAKKVIGHKLHFEQSDVKCEFIRDNQARRRPKKVIGHKLHFEQSDVKC